MGSEEKIPLSELICTITKISTPPIIASLVYFIVQFISIYYIGNLDDSILLAGVGMGIMLINILAFAILYGLNCALDTLVSQSFGAKSYEMCGVYLNRGRLINTVLMLPITVILMNTESLLIAMKQDPAISVIASKFCIMMIPGIWAMTMYDATRRFLCAQF